MFKMYRRVFLINGDTVTDSARSGLYYILSVTAQLRQMNEKWVLLFLSTIPDFLGRRVHILEWKRLDFQY